MADDDRMPRVDIPSDQYFADFFDEAVAARLDAGASLFGARLAAFRETILCYREFSTTQPAHRAKRAMGMERCRFLSPLDDAAYRAAWDRKADTADRALADG